MSAHVCVLGDYDPVLPAHHALDAAREHAVAALSTPVSFEWVDTDALNLDDLGTRYQGLWVAPGSPYRDEARVLEALRRARTSGLPTFGNCGGFQFMVLEYARNVVGLSDARHAESAGPGSGPVVIAPLTCSLKGLSETVTVVPETKLARLAGAGTMEGRYFCSYGVASTYQSDLERGGLVWTSWADGQPRSFELPGHRFYLGCLFQPALSSQPGRANPLILGFLRAVVMPSDSYYPVTLAQWRAWLATHHTTSPGVWLVLERRSAGTPCVGYEEAVEEALCWGWIDSVKHSHDALVGLQRFTRRKPGSIWAVSNKTRVARLEDEGRMQPVGRAIIEAARRDGSWSRYDDADAGVIPDDLVAAWADYPDAARNYAAYPAGEQKRVLGWLAGAKTAPTRARRALDAAYWCQQNVRFEHWKARPLSIKGETQ